MQPDDDKTQAVTVLSKGTVIGHYRIVEKIGAGGMGEVYLAEDTELNRKVALKFLSPHLCQDAHCRARFKREAQAAAKLGHSNIVAVHEVGEHQNRPFFAMEFVEGRSLDKIVAAGRLDEGKVIELTLGICNGLRKAHESGVIHRDIKPSNIIVDRDNVPRVLDFGLAAVLDCDGLTQTGSTLGTVGYMSPEQVAGQAADARSDLFSLGVVLYEMVAGVNPFRRDNQAATLRAICDARPDPVARRRTGISTELERIIGKLLEKSPEVRYQTAADVVGDLRALAKRSPGTDLKLTPDPSIAVLPFANLSADPEQEYFCDGMSEEIINALSHLENIRVIARTSAFAFKGKHEDVRDIGRQLGVEHLLEGSVRKAGKRLRITAQLVKASDGSHLWSERYDREMEDVFAIQDEISLAIVDRLKIKLFGDEEAILARKRAYDLEAYNLYLQGRFYWNKRTPQELKKALEFFERAIERDPDFALAYAGMADTYSMLNQVWELSPAEAFPKAKSMALKALEKDELLGEAHASLGYIAYVYDWDWPKAESEFKRAIELNPGYASAHQWYSQCLELMNRKEQSAEEIEKAQTFDPLSLIIRISAAWFHCEQGEFAQAEEQCRTTLSMDRDFWVVHFVLGSIYERRGLHDQAIGEYLECETAIGFFDPQALEALRTALEQSGWQGYWQKHLLLLKLLAGHRYISPYVMAQDYARLDELDLAFEWLEKAYEQHDPGLLDLQFDAMSSRLGSDRRFAALLKKMGLDE